jgi:4-hydroxy-2-oxoheptanedioate aldolase
MQDPIRIPSLENVKKFRAGLESENGVFGPFMITSDPAFVESAGYAGYDFVLLDMEHGPGTFENLQNLIRAANVADVMPVVRVPRGTDIWIDQALDVGAGGVMIPQIDTAEQAKIAVAAAKFSPRGNRGTCRFVRSAAYGGIPGARYFAEAQDTVVILQAEGKKAIENLDAILDVEGIDIVFVGPYDLSASLGIIGQIDHPMVMEAIADICRRAAKKNVKVGCFADNVQSARKLRDMGVKFLGYSCDTAIFQYAAAADVAAYRK